MIPQGSDQLLVGAATDPAKAQADAGPRLTLPWLVRLRWAAVAAQTLLVWLAARNRWLPTVSAVAGLVALGTLWNLGLELASRRPTLSGLKGVLGTTLLADVLLLTALLMLTGGPSNPFSVVYLV